MHNGSEKIGFGHALTIEWSVSYQHFEENNSKRPMIGAPRVAAIQKDLRRNIQGCATHRVSFDHDTLCEAKINDHSVPISDGTRCGEKFVAQSRRAKSEKTQVDTILTLCC